MSHRVPHRDFARLAGGLSKTRAAKSVFSHVSRQSGVRGVLRVFHPAGLVFGSDVFGETSFARRFGIFIAYSVFSRRFSRIAFLFCSQFGFRPKFLAEKGIVTMEGG
jgi:hypothetical protein